MDLLLHPDTVAELEALRRAGYPAAFSRPTRGRDQRPAYTVAPDGAATIDVVGVLSPGDSFLSMLMGGTSYGAIRDALSAAQSDAQVQRVVLHVDSPGGTVAGLFETLDAIAAFGKPMSVRATRAASAAYAIAAAGGKIEAAGRASEFGSIGVAATYYVFDDEVSITSTAAPDKRPNPSTPEGKATIRRHLDSIHELFVQDIAAGRTRAGRKTTSAGVSRDYGRGAVLLAADALRAGMIDSIAGAASTSERRPGESQTSYAKRLIENMRAPAPSDAADTDTSEPDDDDDTPAFRGGYIRHIY